MPISPAANEAYAVEIRRVYAESERIMLSKVARRLERGIESPGWAETKLMEIRRVRADVEAEVRRLRRTSDDVARAIQDRYEAGSKAAITDLAKITPSEQIATTFTVTNRRAVEAIVSQATRALESTHFRILRAVDDAYRRVIAEASSQVVTGTLTRREAAQVALNRFADAGISGFVDSTGRNWDLASYSEMAVRSASGQAAVQGHLDRLQQNGHDLVIVSNSPEECPLCRPWEGRVLSVSGSDPERASVAEARAAGLFHANCSHSLGAYIEGLTRPMTDTPNPQGYEERQQQRYIERQIRKWKRREAVALTDDERKRARAKVRAWQARQREFVADTDRRRPYDREQIKGAR